jgi:hypothetical protein
VKTCIGSSGASGESWATERDCDYEGPQKSFVAARFIVRPLDVVNWATWVPDWPRRTPGGGDCRSWRIRPLDVPVIGKTMPFDKSF